MDSSDVQSHVSRLLRLGAKALKATSTLHDCEASRSQKSDYAEMALRNLDCRAQLSRCSRSLGCCRWESARIGSRDPKT